MGQLGTQPAAKFYSLTRTGKKQLKAELATWEKLSAAIALVIAGIQEASA